MTVESTKAVDRDGPTDHDDDFAELYLRQMWHFIAAGHSSWVGRAVADVERFMADNALPLSEPSREFLISRLQLHAEALLRMVGIDVGAGPPDLVQRRWVVDLIAEAYQAGLVHHAIGPKAAWPVVREAFKQRRVTHDGRTVTVPYTDRDRAMISHIRSRAGAYMRRVAYTSSDLLNQRILEADMEAAKRRLLVGTRAKIPTERLAGFMADLTGRKVDRGDGKEMWADGRWQRDWRRVARTEMAFAHAYGGLSAMLQAHPVNAGKAEDKLTIPDALVFKQPQKVLYRDGKLWAPCKHCYRIWYADDDTPRLYPLKEVIGNGENVGRKPDDWIATIGPTHPNDLCGPLRRFVPATLHLYPGMDRQIQAFKGKGMEGVP